MNTLCHSHLYNIQIPLLDDHAGTHEQRFHEKNILLAPRFEPTIFRLVSYRQVFTFLKAIYISLFVQFVSIDSQC